MTPTPSITTSGFGTYTPGKLPKLAASQRPELTADERKLRKTTEQLVAQTFFAPMMKEMRDSPFKSEMFSGGRGGSAFSSLLDQQLISHAARGQASGLVDAVVSRFHHQMESGTPKDTLHLSDNH